jgi:hypothetical protein
MPVEAGAVGWLATVCEFRGLGSLGLIWRVGDVAAVLPAGADIQASASVVSERLAAARRSASKTCRCR